MHVKPMRIIYFNIPSRWHAPPIFIWKIKVHVYHELWIRVPTCGVMTHFFLFLFVSKNVFSVHANTEDHAGDIFN